MLDLDTRTAILKLSTEGHSRRFIAETLKLSPRSVRRVIESGQREVPTVERPSRLTPHLEQIRALEQVCKGNVVRVHEMLHDIGVDMAYSTLTEFCRKHEIGYTPPQRSGRYVFEPGKEMQHDTSPHRVPVGGASQSLVCASLVLCFSRWRYIQCYRRWTRWHARCFLTGAFTALQGAAETCMVDNSTVILEGGTGKNARPSAEMRAFSQHFDFQFVAHEAGDANRSARVESPFCHVENNFYPGRTFVDLPDLNQQLLGWCATYNRTFHKSFQGVPDMLLAMERPHLKPLPAHVPEPTEIHPRRVDHEGMIVLHTNTYSVPDGVLGHLLDVHETPTRVRVFAGHRLLVEHDKREDGAHQRVVLPEHTARRARRKPTPPSPEEAAIRAADPCLSALCDVLRARRGGGAVRALQRLYRLWTDYPDDAVIAAVSRALDHDLVDLDRIESLILQHVRGAFFRLPNP